MELLSKLRDLVIDWVQEGFQDFFRKLNDHFFLLSGKKNPAGQDLSFHEGIQRDKILPGLVLVLAQLSVFVEQNAIPRITEVSGGLAVIASIILCSAPFNWHFLTFQIFQEIASSFSGGGSRGYENGPAFVPAEICRTFRAAGEKFLQHVCYLYSEHLLSLTDAQHYYSFPVTGLTTESELFCLTTESLMSPPWLVFYC